MPNPHPQPAIAPARRVGRYEILLEEHDDGLVLRSVARVHGPNAGPAVVVLSRVVPSLSSNVEVRAAFLAEARAATRVRHASFMHPTDSLLHNGELYGAVELNLGVRLDELTVGAQRASRSIPVGIAIRIVLDVLAGLSALHTSNTGVGLRAPAHGDVVPANVLIGWGVSCAPSRGVARVVHSGLASAVIRAGVTGQHGGRLAYKAPEQLRTGSTLLIGAAADVFAAGVVLWELLAGQRLFEAPGALAVVERVLSLPIPYALIEDRVSPAVVAALATALERAPERRFPSAIDFAEALTRGAGTAIASAEDVAIVTEEVLGPLLADRRRALETALNADANTLQGPPSSSGASSYVRRAGSLRTPVGIVYPPADLPPSSERIRAARAWSPTSRPSGFARPVSIVPSPTTPPGRPRSELGHAGRRQVADPRPAEVRERDPARSGGLPLGLVVIALAIASVVAYAMQRPAASPDPAPRTAPTLAAPTR